VARKKGSKRIPVIIRSKKHNPQQNTTTSSQSRSIITMMASPSNKKSRIPSPARMRLISPVTASPTGIRRGVRRLRSGTVSGGKKETKSPGSNRIRSKSATPIMRSALKTHMKHQQPDVTPEEDKAAARAKAIADARRDKLQKGMSSLDRKSLDSVNAHKNSIKEMRMKFGSTNTTTTSDKKRASDPLLSPVPTPRSTIGLEPSSTNSVRRKMGLGEITPVPSPRSTIGLEPSSTSSARRKMGLGEITPVPSPRSTIGLEPSSTSSTRRKMGLGEITVNDLDIGFLKRQEQRKQLQREIKAASLERQVSDAKNLIQRTCTDVLTERDQLNSFQRKNWSARKKLMQMEAPEDSVTSLNLKIEKLVRQDRVMDSDIDRANEERQTLESECADMAKTISQMKYLLDDLHKHVVPLLSSGEPAKRNPKLHFHLKDSELDDTIHSMAGDDEASLSIRILSSASA
jgi:hypothetical protein